MYSVGKVFTNKFGDSAEVISLVEGKYYHRTIRFLKSGYVRNTTTTSLKRRNFVDKSDDFYKVGDVFINTQGHKAEIIKKLGPKRKIRFIKSGYETVVETSNLRQGKFKDYDYPSVYGVGYSYKGAKNNIKVYKTWHHMLERCYSEKSANYHYYGGRGVRVCDRWLRFINFSKDIKKLKNYQKWNEQNGGERYYLDKDILGDGMLYSKETCMFATQYQQMEQATGKPVISISPDGETRIHRTVNQACRDLGVQNANVYKVLNGERKSTMGYQFKRL